MRLIKKYANRKLYDTAAKQYIAQARVADLIKNGEPVRIVDHVSGEDITVSVVSRLLGEEKETTHDGITTGISTSILFQLLRKGSDTLTDYAHKYTALFQSAMTMAEDEVDGLVRRLVKDREISVGEAKRLKQDLVKYTDHLKSWLGEKTDQRVNEILGRMNLVTKTQVAQLTGQMEALSGKVDRLEKAITTNEAVKQHDAEQ